MFPIQPLKALVVRVLRRYNRHIVYSPPGAVRGLDLIADLRLLVPADRPVCFDVGANRGQTIALLREAFARPRIHAFEPSTATFHALEQRRFGDDVVLHRMALGAAPERRTFTTYAASDLSSFLPLDAAPENRFRDVAAVTSEDVQIDTVDAVVARLGLPTLDVLKIDMQGFDREVLRGAEATLRAGRVNVVLIELNFVKMYQGQAAPPEILAALMMGGYYLVGLYEIVREEQTVGWCTAVFQRRTTGQSGQ